MSCPALRTTIRRAWCVGSRRRRRPISRNSIASIFSRRVAAAPYWRGAPTTRHSPSEPMTYSVKEIYYTLQGEGAQAGRAAVFCRFAGCNLWSGLERDRAKAVCQFCDTDFVGTDGPGGGKFDSPQSLARAVGEQWGGKADSGRPLVVCTGGEPLLQLDVRIDRRVSRRRVRSRRRDQRHAAGPAGSRLDLRESEGGTRQSCRWTEHELKLVYPQPLALPEQFAALRFRHFFLQPMDGLDCKRNTQDAIDYCLQHPQWRLSIQTHKVLGIA